MKKIYNYIILIGIIGSVIATCYWFVNWMTHTSHPGWHFTGTGEIGDTIGGLTAPVLGIFNALLLFYTLRKQEENRQEDNLNNEVWKRVEVIRKLIDKSTIYIAFSSTKDYADELQSGEFTGESAYLHLNAVLGQSGDSIKLIKIHTFQWRIFITFLKDAEIEALIILQRNFNSNISIEEKITNYTYISKSVHSIIHLYDVIQEFVSNNEGHDYIKKYHLDDILRLRSLRDEHMIYLKPRMKKSKFIVWLKNLLKRK
jgi:hypothetical protein